MTKLMTLPLLLACLSVRAEDLAPPVFESQDIDTKVQIGYGLAIGDVDGDKKPDIMLVDKKQVVWYQNPAWTRHVLCEDVTKIDNVCIAGRDTDGDGKVEIAIGANWNPGDTVNSGSVHYLIAPEDRKQKWEVVNLPNEPVVHRMRWVLGTGGKYNLFVSPLHGRGNKAGQGAGVKQLAYTVPANVKDTWKTDVVDESMHVTHNFDVVQWDGDPEEEIVLGGKEGIVLLDRNATGWARTPLAETGAGEVRVGKLAGGKRFVTAVEAFHGSIVVVHTPGEAGKLWQRAVIDEALKEGHALACADLAGIGSDQIIMGWRNPNSAGKVGINIYMSKDGERWQKHALDDNGMACEDLMVADLDGDGKLDVIAAGRATKNLKVYWNKGAKK